MGAGLPGSKHQGFNFQCVAWEMENQGLLAWHSLPGISPGAWALGVMWAMSNFSMRVLGGAGRRTAQAVLPDGTNEEGEVRQHGHVLAAAAPHASFKLVP